MEVFNLRKLNTDFEGTEYCVNCNTETEFKYNPVKGNGHIKCMNCGKEISVCNLCYDGCGSGNCKQQILKSLNDFEFKVVI